MRYEIENQVEPDGKITLGTLRFPMSGNPKLYAFGESRTPRRDQRCPKGRMKTALHQLSPVEHDKLGATSAEPETRRSGLCADAWSNGYSRIDKRKATPLRKQSAAREGLNPGVIGRADQAVDFARAHLSDSNRCFRWESLPHRGLTPAWGQATPAEIEIWPPAAGVKRPRASTAKMVNYPHLQTERISSSACGTRSGTVLPVGVA